MPVRINGRIMIDGGVFNPIPYEHLMDCADIVIAVDVVGAPEGDDNLMPNRIDSMFGVRQLMMQSRIRLRLTSGRRTSSYGRRSTPLEAWISSRRGNSSRSTPRGRTVSGG